MQLGVIDTVIEVEFEVLALPHVVHPVETQPGQRPRDRLPLRVKDLGFEDDVDDHSCHAGKATRYPWQCSDELIPDAGGDPGVQIVHFEHSCVLTETANTRLLIDPGIYSSGFEELTDLDAILVTHQHPDHLDIERLPALVATNPGAELVADAGSAPQLTDAGLAPRVVRPGERLKLAGTTVDVIGGEHGVIHPDIPVIPNNGYLIDGGAGTILHPGDSFTLSGLDISEIDVLLLPTAAPWFKISEAVDYLRAVDPGLAVPIHQALLSRPEKFYGLLRELAPTATEVHVVLQGEPLML